MNTITANGIDLSYVDSGAGRPLLLVHGFPVDHSIWASQIPARRGNVASLPPTCAASAKAGPATASSQWKCWPTIWPRCWKSWGSLNQ